MITNEELLECEASYSAGMSMEQFIEESGHTNSNDLVKNRLKARWRTLRNKSYQQSYKSHHTEVRFFITDTQLRSVAMQSNMYGISVAQFSKRVVLESTDLKKHEVLPKTPTEVLLRKALTVLNQAEKQTNGFTKKLVQEHIEELKRELSSSRQEV